MEARHRSRQEAVEGENKDIECDINQFLICQGGSSGQTYDGDYVRSSEEAEAKDMAAISSRTYGSRWK